MQILDHQLVSGLLVLYLTLLVLQSQKIFLSPILDVKYSSFQPVEYVLQLMLKTISFLIDTRAVNTVVQQPPQFHPVHFL